MRLMWLFLNFFGHDQNSSNENFCKTETSSSLSLGCTVRINSSLKIFEVTFRSEVRGVCEMKIRSIKKCLVANRWDVKGSFLFYTRPSKDAECLVTKRIIIDCH
jgi:hypothetical protein